MSKIIRTVEVQAEIEPTPPPVYLLQVAVNCTTRQTIEFFNSVDDKRGYILCAINCGISVDFVADHDEVISGMRQKHNALVLSESTYFHDTSVSNSIHALLSQIEQQGGWGACIDRVKVGTAV